MSSNGANGGVRLHGSEAPTVALRTQSANLAGVVAASGSITLTVGRPPLFTRIAPIVEAFAEGLQAVRRAYVREDGAEFLLLGEVIAPELGASVARLSVALQRAFAPDMSPYIDGGYEAVLDRPLDGYVLVFERT